MTALDYITLCRDELEALRLCDVEGLTQEQAGRCMGISRGTVQRLLMRRRKRPSGPLSHQKQSSSSPKLMLNVNLRTPSMDKIERAGHFGSVWYGAFLIQLCS